MKQQQNSRIKCLKILDILVEFIVPNELMIKDYTKSDLKS